MADPDTSPTTGTDEAGPWTQFQAPAQGAGRGPWEDFHNPVPPNYSEPLVDATPETVDMLERSPIGKVISAFGMGAKDGFGTGNLGLSEESQASLTKAGIMPDLHDGQTSIGRALWQGVMLPAASATDLAIRTGKAALEGTVAGATELAETIHPGAGQATQNVLQGAMDPALAANIEALPIPPLQAAGMALSAARPALGLLSRGVQAATDLEEARSLHVIGPGGEGAYMGTTDVPPLTVEDEAALSAQTAKDEQAAPNAPTSPDPVTPPAVPAPDIHQVARTIAPDTFAKYDPLVQRQTTFRSWLTDLDEQRRTEVTANAPHNDAIATLDAQITDLNARLPDANQRMAKIYNGRLSDAMDQKADLEDANAAWIADQTSRDTPDMAKVRAALMQNDFAMRDLAPQVSAAYREAQAQMPQEPIPAPQVREAPVAAPEAPAEPPPSAVAQPEAAAEPVPAAVEPEAAPTAPAQPIAQTVAARLTAAGRPAEEAEVGGALLDAYYNARAARLGGIDPQQLFAEEGPGIRAGRQRVRATEMAQRGGRTLDQTARGKITFGNGQRVITLLKDADPSTFIHETGHMWLDDLVRDAADPRAIDQVRGDAQTVRDWIGAKPGEDIKRAQHEKFARGFERYMMEGIAPSQKLAGVFAKFKQWLTTIYQTVAKLRSPINDNIRQVFDRMLAVPGEAEPIIAPERAGSGSFADIHEADAETTPVQHALDMADTVRQERDTEGAANHPPEFNNERLAERRGPEAGGNAEGSPLPDGGGNAPGTEPGAEGARPGDGAVGESRTGPTRARPHEPRYKAEPLGERIYKPVPKAPRRLGAFLRSLGGLMDESTGTAGGDVRAILGDHKAFPGMLNNKDGLGIDVAAHAAWEAGYFPDAGETVPTANDLLDALRDDLAGNARYSFRDQDALASHTAAVAHNDEITQLSSRFEIDPKGMTKQQFWDAVAEKQSAAEFDKTMKSLDDAHDEAFSEAERQYQEWVATRGEAWEPQAEAEPRTQEDMEREHQSEQAALASRPGEGEATGTEPAAGGGEPVQAGGGQRGGGAGSGRRVEPEAGTAGGGEGTERHLTPNELFPDDDQPFIDKAGNIRMDLINSDEDTKNYLRQVAAENNDFLEARRGVVPHQKIIDFAASLGVEPSVAAENIERLRAMSVEDGIPLGARILGGGNLLTQSAEDVRAAMKSGDVDAFIALSQKHLRYQETFSGVTAEWGRAGHAFQIMLKQAKSAQQLSEFLQGAIGKTTQKIEQMMQLGAQLDTPAAVSKFMQDSRKPSFGDMLYEYWVNGLISGPATHMTYTMGNAALAMWKAVPETLVAGAIGGIRRGLGETGETVHMGEAGARLYGMAFQGVRNGIIAAGKAARTGMTTALPGEEEASLLPMQTYAKGAIPGPIGTVVRLPGRGVAMIHSFYRYIGYSSSVAAKAYREAAESEKTGKDFFAAIAEGTRNPSVATMATARAESNTQALMGQTGDFTRRLQQVLDTPLLGTRPLRFISPFVKIGSNITRQVILERTPFGVFDQGIRDNLLGRNGRVAQDEQYARILVGSSLGAASAGLAAEGKITGAGPSDPNEMRVWRLNGYQPYSVKIGDTWYAYHRLGPLGMLIGLAADGQAVAHAMSDDHATNVAHLIISSASKSLLDESWLRGPADLIQAIEDPDRYGARYVRDQLSSFVPFSVGMSQMARAADPYQRQARTLLDQVRSKVPYMSESLLPRRDLWGEPIPNSPAFGGSGISAIYESKANNDPVNKALMDLHISPALPSRKIRGVALSDQQYDDYSRIAGRVAKMRLNAIVAAPGFTGQPAEVRREVITRTVDGAREQARAQIMMTNPGIIREAMDAKRKQVSGTP